MPSPSLSHHLILLCSLFFALLTALPSTSNLGCPFEPLPLSLDTLAGVGVDGEVHLHNEYFTDYTRGKNHSITFTLNETSDVRVYVEPHYFDIDVWIFQNKTAMAHTSDYSLADEVVFATLPPGSYYIRYYFFGTFTGTCPTMITEISIIPTARLAQRLSSYQCPSSQQLPVFDLSDLSVSDYEYGNASDTLNVQYKPTGAKYVFLQSYPLYLPPGNTYGEGWEVEAVLNFHFPTTTLGLLLQDVNASAPTNLSCFDAGNCSIAYHNARGQSTLKILLVPGIYMLYLYDVPGERNVTACSPFTMSLHVSLASPEESFLNCAGEPFPSSLNKPGLKDQDGFLYYRENVLLYLTETTSVLPFSVEEDSYFRAFTVAHRIDIDLQLRSSNNTVLAYGLKLGSAEEAIQYYLAPGNYTLRLILFGQYGESFCDTVMTEIAIAPASLYSRIDLCTNQSSSTSPDLSGLTNILSNTSYKLPYSVYRYNYNGSYSQNVLLSQSFNVTTNSYIQAELGSNFLLGDVRIWLLEPTTPGSTTTELGYHRRNMHYLDVLVPPGRYTIQIVAGTTQSGAITNFPSCSIYSLSLRVNPANTTAPAQCLRNRPIPSSLNTPENLLTSPKIHIQEEFLIPPMQASNTWTVREKTTFTVDTPSYFRMYTEPHHIDIDIFLEANGVTAIKAINFNTEEAISWLVVPGVNYSIGLMYFRWNFLDHGSDPCYAFQAEIAITPVRNASQGECGSEYLPQPDVGAVGATALNFDGMFRFNGGSTKRDIPMLFSVPNGFSAAFRVQVMYDFVWSDLALRLALPNSSSTLEGDLMYNKNEITTVQLGPGVYTLHIYEPFNETTAWGNKNNLTVTLPKCVYFRLKFSLELLTDSVDPLMLSCPDQSLSTTWNGPGFLSNLTGNNMIFDRYVLASVMPKEDTVSFTLVSQSAFHLYIPVQSSIDVDVTLFNGTTQMITIASSGKEEAITTVLRPGSYSIKFHYWGIMSVATLPPQSACASFKLEVSIVNFSSLSALPVVKNTCNTSFPLIITPTNGSLTTLNLARLLSQPFYPSTLFAITDTHQFTIHFDQIDPVGGVAMLLQSKNFTRTYNPLYSANHIYFNEYLPAGTYNLSFHDPTGATTSDFTCAPYILSYNLSASPVPDDVCDYNPLPLELTTAAGGSVPYGGPQASDGSIHLVSNSFNILEDKLNRDNFFAFATVGPSKSYLRVFIDVDEGNTITITLLNPQFPGVTLGSLTAVNDKSISTVWALPGNSSTYKLNLQFTKVVSSLFCNYFAFEFVLMPESAVLAALSCPNPLPSEVTQLPPAVINTLPHGDFSFSSDQLLITSTRFFGNGGYSYTMKINAANSTSLSAQVGYNFVVNDFYLVLQTSSGELLTKGVHQQSISTDSDFNFFNYIQWDLDAGTYSLAIVDATSNNFNITTFCHFFSFSITLAATGVDDIPRLLQIQPGASSDLDPTVPLVLTVVFSEPASFTVPTGYSLSAYIIAANIIYLKDTGNNSKSAMLSPISSTFDSSNTQLTLRFLPPFTSSAYSLYINTSFFISTASGVRFSAGLFATQMPTYSMRQNCTTCSGHGVCTAAGACACDKEWTGPKCDRCAPGYHVDATGCVADLYCNASSCNGHGSCYDAAGSAQCFCTSGFTGAACEQCDVNYSGYPNCTANPDSDEDSEGEACTAPLLPNSLNTAAYLGYTGHLHMQGFYYMSIDLKIHEMAFTITETSAFRIYTEPHDVDVDVWLFRVNQNGATTTVAYEISFGLEETMYTTLPPADYIIRLRYYTWVTPKSTCNVFDLELAIAPLKNVTAEANSMKYYCGASNKLPSIPSLNLSAPYEFSGKAFTVNAPTNKSSTAPNYFYSINITISPPSPTSIASIHATVGYRFLQGDISIMLEAGTKGTRCLASGFSTTPPAGCVYGDNIANENTLHRYLEAGSYILWIYEPIPQNSSISTCSPFDFSLQVEFVDDEEDIFNCDLPLIPLSLDNSEYAENPLSIHFHDYFVLDGRTMSFNVNFQSYLRVAITGPDVYVNLFSYNNTFNLQVQVQNIFEKLSPGSYYLKFSSGLFEFCPVLDIEFALAPISNFSCPAKANQNPPTIDFTKLPVVFAPNRSAPAVPTFYTYNTQTTPIVASYSFRTTTSTFLDVGVESGFLLGDLHIQLLTSASADAPILGWHDYNFNKLQQVLPAGSYELRIVLPTQSMSSPSACIPYNLQLSLVATSGVSSAPACYGEHLPYSFNTMHYLGTDGQMNYQSDDWLVPSNFVFATLHDIRFYVNSTSIIRVYTEPHSTDIDIKLFNSNSADPKLLASGSNKIGTEESFTYVLASNTTFILELQFYNFLSSKSANPCNTFNMQVAIAPIPPRPYTCPGNANSWPQLPSPTSVPFAYNSIDNNEKLYYQQATSTAMNYSAVVSVSDRANVYIDLGYDFLVGDLVVTLYSPKTKNNYVGSNRRNRNTLNLINIPADNYTLRFYEPTANVPEAVGCSEFTFSIYIEPYSTYIAEEKYTVEYYLPQTLDSIPYLNASSRVHIANDYFMFDGSGLHENTTFTLKEASLLHARTYMADSPSGKADPPQLTLVSGANHTPYKGFLRTVLQPGTYMLKISPPPYVDVGGLGVLVSVEIAIDTLANINDLIAASPENAACISSPFSAMEVDPSGYYQSGGEATIDSDELLNTGEFAQIAFSLDRYSLVYFQVGSMFIITELEVIVISSNYTVYVHGRMRKNINEIHQIFPPGNYTLIITQTQDQSDSGIPEHCGLFSYSIIIKDADNAGVLIDCSTLNQLPWQLDDRSGGSALYGGPITNGSVHVYGAGMHIPTNQASSRLNFTLAAPSVLSILASDYTSFSFDFTVSSNITGVQTPIQSVVATNVNSRLTQYSLDASSYQLTLNYHPAALNLGGCSSFTLQIDLAPSTELINDYTCTNVTPQQLPTDITLDSTGTAYDVISSFFNGSQVSGMAKAIRFTTVAKSTDVVFSFAYNSLVTSFAIRLARVVGNTSTLVIQGRTKGQQIQTGETTVYQYIAVNVAAGNYTLRITHPTLAAPFNSSQICPPFILSYEIGNVTTLSIMDVDPPGSRFLSTTDPFTITLTFSAPPYNSSGAVLSAYDAAIIMNAFYLNMADGVPVFPFNVVPSLNRQKWTLYFSALGTAGRTYTLSLKPNVLFDRNGVTLSLPKLYQYTTADCGTHGTIVNGKCVCSTGYAGANCLSCDVVNFYQPSSDAPSICVLNQCKSNTCGCMDPPTCTTPLGSCSTNSSSVAICKCGPNYQGAHCELCLPNLINYPYCNSNTEACKTFTCNNHGSCVTNATGAHCNCQQAYQGDHCEVCSPGYVSYPLCSPMDPCATFQCGNVGTCSTNSTGLAHCTCPSKYTGEHCEECAPGYTNYPICSVADACSAYTCNNHGTCNTDKSGNAYCDCQTQYAGDHCDSCKTGYINYPSCTLVAATCTGFTCNNLGTCAVNETKLPHCTCPKQFAGEHCELCAPGYINYPTCLPDLDPCDSYSCNSHGTCSLDTILNPSCACDPNYSGDHCEKCEQGFVNYPTCSPSPCNTFTCNSAGTCAVNTTGLAHCTCFANYQGEHCEACKAGYTDYPSCTSTTTCQPACKNGGMCTGGVCKCVNHWTGATCDVCPANFAGPACDQCAQGFTGSACETKSESPSGGGGKALSGVKVFFIVVGVLVSVALLGAGGFLLFKRYRGRGAGGGGKYSSLNQLLLQDDTKFHVEDDSEL